MENQRMFLFIALTMIMFLMWEAWQKDYGVPPQAPASAPVTQNGIPAETKGDVPSVPSATSTAADDSLPGATPAKTMRSGQRIRVSTDVLQLEIDTLGGDIRKLSLPAYPVSVKTPDVPFELMTDDGHAIFIAQGGLLSKQHAAPDHHAPYYAEQSEYHMAPGAKTLDVKLRWNGPDGLVVYKSYHFRRGDYLVDVSYEVVNNTTKDWGGRHYAQMQHTRAEGLGSSLVYTYTGGVVSTKEKIYEKISFDDIEGDKPTRNTQGGWLAMIQHYFLAAWVPNQESNNHYYTKALGNDRFMLGVVTPAAKVPAGKSARVADVRFYAGPKTQGILEKIAPGLELTVDYGVLTILAKPLFWGLKYIHSVVNNWGWSIILLTVFIKLMFYKLSEASYRSMANMKKLHPRLVTLKERYADDKQKLHQAMMDIYKKEKINPLGGCLPILVQIPVFIALYWVLLESVELRQASFVFWLNDLSTKDPFYVLPVIMGVTMLLQHKLNPTPLDPVQAKVMMILPLVFTVFFAFFPSGLVLYWVVNNTLSIAQQWVINKRITGKAA